MCDKCSRGQSDFGHGVRVGQERESNDRDPSRAARDPNYGGRASYDSGRSRSYADGVRQGRENVRNSDR